MRFIFRILVLLAVSVTAALLWNAYGLDYLRGKVSRSIDWVMDREAGEMMAPPAQTADATEKAEYEIDLARATELYNQSATNPGTVFFLDARNHDDYVAGHIPGAINVPAAEVLRKLEYVQGIIPPIESVPVVIYCGGGDCRDSKVAYRDLKGFDYPNLLIFTEGWEEWSKPENNLPIETGESSMWGSYHDFEGGDVHPEGP